MYLFFLGVGFLVIELFIKDVKKNIVKVIKFKLYFLLLLVKVNVICKRCIFLNWFNKRVLRLIKYLEC